MSHPDYTDEELSKLLNFPPSISGDEMEELAEAASDKARGLQRRLVLLACTRSADDLRELSIEQGEAFSEMLESIEVFKAHAQGLIEIAEIAVLRMKIVDCRKHGLNPKHLINTSVEGMQ